MVDLWRMQKIDEKVDIWALGCLLYRLCFFFHPFDEGGNLGIINVNYKIPSESPYSQDLHKFIQFMIQPDPTIRPNIFQVIEYLSKLRGVPNTAVNPNVSTNSHQNTQQQQSPTTNSNRSQQTGSKTQTTTSSNSSNNKSDVFSMLDWHDASPNSSRNTNNSKNFSTTQNSSFTTNQSQTQKNVMDNQFHSGTSTSNTAAPAFDDFADFSNANFVSSGSVSNHDFDNSTSFFSAPEAQTQLKTSNSSVNSSSFTFEESPTQSQTNLPSQPAANNFFDFQPTTTDFNSNVTTTQTVNPPISSTSNLSYSSFRNEFSSIQPSSSANTSPLRNSGNSLHNSGSFDFNSNSTPNMLQNQNFMMQNQNQVSMNQNFNTLPINSNVQGNMNVNIMQQQMHTRHGSFGNQPVFNTA